MASQKYPVVKDSSVKLSYQHKDAETKDLNEWMDKHTTESDVVRSDSEAVQTFGRPDVLLQQLLDACKTGPSKPVAVQATGSNGFSVHSYFGTSENHTISQEVGTAVAAGTNLVTLNTNCSRNNNREIIQIDSTDTPGSESKTAEASVVGGAYNPAMPGYNDDSNASVNNVADNAAANVQVKLTVGDNSANPSGSVSVKAAKTLYVTPAATTEGRVRLKVQGVAPSHNVIFRDNTLTVTGDVVFRGTVDNVVLSEQSQSTDVPQKTVALAPVVTAGTYYMGIGYRKFFFGTYFVPQTNNPNAAKEIVEVVEDADTQVSYQSVMTALSGNGVRSTAGAITLINSAQASNTEKTNDISGAKAISNAPTFIVIPATQSIKDNKVEFSVANIKQYATVKQLTFGTSSVTSTINVNGANSKFPAGYKVYFIVNSNNKVVSFSADTYVKFTLINN